jgi:hypothetical protein
MEKALLVASLFGTVHLVLLALSRFGNVAIFGHKPRANPLPVGVGQHEKKPVDRSLPALLRKDGEEDWSKYDIPTFLRRGIPMPKLEVVPAKKPAKRRKATKKSAVEAPTETATRFEVVL